MLLGTPVGLHTRLEAAALQGEGCALAISVPGLARNLR